MALTISLNAKAITAANLNRTQLKMATLENSLRTGYNIVDTCLRSVTFSRDDKNVSTLMLRGNELGLSRSIAPLKNLTLLEKLQTIDISNNGLSQVQVSNIVNQLYQSALINSLRTVNYNIGGNNAIPDVKALIQLDELQNNYGFVDGNISVFTTDNSVDASKSFVIDGTAGDITVDWGDGVTETQTMGSGAITFNHTYAGTGTNTGYIRGALASIASINCNTCELNSIEVEQMVALTDLILSTNNITTLDVSKNILLQNLYIDTTNIATLDISNNIELISLQAGSANINSLDITANINLETLNLQSCDMRKASEIDAILIAAAANGKSIDITLDGNTGYYTLSGRAAKDEIILNGGTVSIGKGITFVVDANIEPAVNINITSAIDVLRDIHIDYDGEFAEDVHFPASPIGYTFTDANIHVISVTNDVDYCKTIISEGNGNILEVNLENIETCLNVTLKDEKLTEVDILLTDCAANGEAITIDVSGGANAAPSTADGVPPISTIVANGGSVTHN